MTLALLLLAQAAPEWIWSSTSPKDGEVVHFLKAFDLPAKPDKALLAASCDNRMEIWINGVSVAASDDWQRPARLDVAGRLVAGRNVVAVRAENEGGIAALVLRLDRLRSDASWLWSAQAPKGWEKPDFDSKGWKPAVPIAKLGDGPWGNVLEGVVSPAPALQGLPDFKVDVLYTVPKEEGSWVSMAFDPQGRIIVGPQSGKPLRVTLGADIKVEKLDVAVGDAQGLLHAFDSLYITGNGPQGTGLYRWKEGAEAVLLKKWPGGMGEHGPHAVVLGPDKKIYCVVGNHVKVPPGMSNDSPHRNYQEDLLLPRMWDPNGHAAGILAPGGYIARTDAEGKDWELWCGGFRNQYDAAFSAAGELFTYDSDMEWDLGTPWYRPTRIYHLVQGGEYGWRSASGKWPAYYPDNLPMTADIGLGSPTGMEFGTGAKFPAKYQRALYALDWAYGKIYAVHLKPDGASYSSTFEPFVTGKPLNVADIEVGPDGALYFVTGGRGTQSRLYRVTYTGSESTSPAPAETAGAEARALRRELETWQTQSNSHALRIVLPSLHHPDRWIRFAARIALEKQDLTLWKDLALAEPSIEALLALARVGGKELLPKICEKLGTDLDALRVYQVAFTRLGAPDEATRALVLKKCDALYPAATEPLNRELCVLLIYLKAPKVVERTLALLAKAATGQEQLHYGFHLRSLKEGWTIETRRAYFAWFEKAQRELKGGHSFQGFIRNSKAEVVANLSEAERKELEPLLARSFMPTPEKRKSLPLVKKWAVEEFAGDVEKPLAGRNFEKGREAFLNAQCLACHRFGGEGGSVGSDLTAIASRFTRRDILDAILLPSKVLSDQYANTMFQTSSGDVVVGRVVGEDAEKILVRTNPLEDAATTVLKKDLKGTKLSPVSPMPEGLADVLKREEILDLIAYLESGGNKGHANFKK
ncbi:MAG TPA: heme-binding protein [Planctomycetota bacterium]